MATNESARRFEFLKQIASGGFGKVYLVQVFDGDEPGPKVALKLLHSKWSNNDEVASRMRDEARLLGWLRHPHIVEVLELTRIDGRNAISMEHLDAVDTRRLLGGGEPVPLRPALEIMASVAEALDAAYTRAPPGSDKPLKVIHRNLKPSNVMVDPAGGVKVLDFGVARAEFDAREARTAELSFGSLEYMPPERLFFEPESGRSDVYSLAAMVFEWVTGDKLGKAKLHDAEQTTFAEKRFLDLLNHVSLDQEVALEVGELLVEMLAFDDADRPDASEVARRGRLLADLVGGPPLDAWAAEVVPPLLAQDDDPLTVRDPLIGQILEEEPDLDLPTSVDGDGSAERDAEGPPGLSVAAFHDPVAQIPEPTASASFDGNWGDLKEKSLQSLSETGEVSARTMEEARKILDDDPPWFGDDEDEVLPTELMVVPRDPPSVDLSLETALDEEPDPETATLLVSMDVVLPEPEELTNPLDLLEEDDASTVHPLLPDVMLPMEPLGDMTIPLSEADYGEETLLEPMLAPLPYPSRESLIRKAPPRRRRPETSQSVMLLASVAVFTVTILAFGGTVLGGAGVAALLTQEPARRPAQGRAVAEATQTDGVADDAGPADVAPAPIPASEPPPTVALPPGAASFASQLPGTTRMTVRCAEITAHGVNPVVVTGDNLGDCIVTAIGAERQRGTAVVRQVGHRPYLCFAAGSSNCR